jgi:hypothetical protein
MVSTTQNLLAETSRRKHLDPKRPRSLTRNHENRLIAAVSAKNTARLSIRTQEDQDTVAEKILKTMSPSSYRAKISESQSVRSLYKQPSSTLANYRATVVLEETHPINETAHLYNTIKELRNKLKDYEAIKLACCDRDKQIEGLSRQIKTNQQENYNLKNVIRNYQDVCKHVIDMHDRGRVRSQSIKPVIDQMKTLNTGSQPMQISRWRPNSEKDLRLASISRTPVKHSSYNNLHQARIESESKRVVLNSASPPKPITESEESPLIRELWEIFERSQRILNRE